MISTSATYKRILCSLSSTLIHNVLGEILVVSAEGLIIGTKIHGDNGHPCLVPLDIGKGLEKKPEVNTETDGQVYNALMASYIGPMNPNLVRTFWTKYPIHPIKRLLASKEINIESEGDLLAN